MCGFIGSGVVGESRKEKRGDGGFATCGLDYGRDLWVWISFWNGVVEPVSVFSPFHVFCGNRHDLETVCVCLCVNCSKSQKLRTE